MASSPKKLEQLAAELHALAAAHAAHCDAPSEGAILQALKKHLEPAETPVCSVCGAL